MERLPYVILLIIGLHVACCFSHDLSHLSAEEVLSMFGRSECIEGSLVEIQPPASSFPTIIDYQDLQVMLKKVGGTLAQQWAPSLSGIYSAFTSANMTTTGRKTETKTASARTEYSDSDFNGKTPMSVVNELALLMKVRPKYKLLNVEGAPHERSFTVSLKFENEEYSASGPSIKKAQQLAANKFLQYTHYQQPLQKMAHKQKTQRKNTGTKTATSHVYELAAKQKLPLTFEVESQTGPPHMPTFVTKCALGDRISRGQGSSKKLSKRAAAEEMLKLMQHHEAYSFLPNSMTRKSKKKRRSSRKKNRTPSLFNSFEQVIPGLRIDQTTRSIMDSEFWDVSDNNGKGLSGQLASFAKRLVKSGSSLFGDAAVKSSPKDTPSSSFKSQNSRDQKVTAKDTLMQAADLLDFKIQFSDLSKQHDGEFLSLVSLSTNLPTLCLGIASTAEASYEQAALRALKALWKLDVEQISDSYSAKRKSDWGDWLHWTEEMIPATRDVFYIK